MGILQIVILFLVIVGMIFLLVFQYKDYDVVEVSQYKDDNFVKASKPTYVNYVGITKTIMTGCYFRDLFYQELSRIIKYFSVNLKSIKKTEFESVVREICTYGDFIDIMDKEIFPNKGADYWFGSDFDFDGFWRKSVKAYVDAVCKVSQIWRVDNLEECKDRVRFLAKQSFLIIGLKRYPNYYPVKFF